MTELLERTRLTREMAEELSAIGGQPSAVSDRPSEKENCHPERSEGSAFAVENSIGSTLAQLLKRPEITIEALVPVLQPLMPEFFNNDPRSSAFICGEKRLSSSVRNELKSVETTIKYAGYLQQQERAIERLKKAEQRSIPEWFDYASVSGLSREMNEKLQRVRPRTLAQASRIPGVTPAAISLLNVFIEIQARRREQAAVI